MKGYNIEDRMMLIIVGVAVFLTTAMAVWVN
jgi:hypothetical protein